MIEFEAPQINPSLTDYTQLPSLMKESTRSIGYMIKLGTEFTDTGISEVDTTITPKLKKMLGSTWPRVITGYSTLLWFSFKVSFN